MRVFQAGAWREVLDSWLGPGEARVQVHAWLRLEAIEDLYVVPRRSLRTLFDYGREIGAKNVARKVASRLLERERSVKWAACGLGRVLEAPGVESGTAVVFFAPCVTAIAERVVVPMELAREWEGELPMPLTEAPTFVGGRFWGDWADWQRDSGRNLGGADLLMDRVVATLEGRDWSSAEHHEFEVTPVSERTEASHSADGEVTASVVGWGHHARTAIAANLPPGIAVGWVHELDPLVAAAADQVTVDTSPHLRDDERPGVVFASGYHSTHAGLAAQAIHRGAAVVSEKPLATTREQLDELMEAWQEPSRYFAAFHKRYSPMNDWLRSDLEWEERGPMSYYCIVHEISLPARHWYRWPSSGSRILSNGCHWIDHFLFLNDFDEVEDFAVRVVRTGEYLCDINLTNGAFFHMLITDRGSDRLGTREHVEVRTPGRTAIIEDAQEYRSETDARLLRRASFNKLAGHASMYRTIGEKIVRGEAGDSRDSVYRSADIVLRIEEALG